MKTARAWKDFYARERAALGREGLERLLDRAPDLTLPGRGALVFPHTRLEASGELVAAAARACVRSGKETVLALGVLHGGREEDTALVARARAGDAGARERLRGVHGAGAPGDLGLWAEEFSLDGFAALLELAAAREGKPAPRLVARYPFLVGETPGDLPGLGELRELVREGAALVATADPIHHGAGYGMPEGERLRASEPATEARARASIERGFALLAARDLRGFLEHSARERSDFRDPGPALAELLAAMGPLAIEVVALRLVDYATVLGAPEPTWVAGALARLTCRDDLSADKKGRCFE